MTDSARYYEVPVYKVALVREGTAPAERDKINSPPDVMVLVKNMGLADADREHFAVLMVDGHNQVIGVHTAAVGTLDAAMVHPREVFKAVLLCNAAAVILVHNHPSGDMTPSKADTEVTKRLVDAGKLLGIEVLDHVIVSGRWYRSLKEHREGGY